MKTPEQIAIDLAQELLAKDLNPEDVILSHNISEVIDNPTVPYKITVKLKPRMLRGEIDGIQ